MSTRDTSDTMVLTSTNMKINQNDYINELEPITLNEERVKCSKVERSKETNTWETQLVGMYV